MPDHLRTTPIFHTPSLLEAFFERSKDGFFFMMIDRPIEWGPHVDQEKVLDYVFANQRMTKVNPAMAEQFRARPEELIGRTPNEFFRHDVQAGRDGWRGLFDAGHSHSVTEERRFDGTTMWVEGDYMCFYDDAGRITGHFGIQRDVTERTLAIQELEQSRRELRALAARLQAAREEERTRIAREIHDELGQALTALKLDLSWLEQRGTWTPSGTFRVGDGSIAAQIDQTLEIVRRIATELRPSVLDQLGLDAAIEWLVQESGKRSGVTVELRADSLPALPDSIASHAFRIIQEALTNVSRHAKATRADVIIRWQAPWLVIEVRDDGSGIAPESLSGIRSLGLLGMRERAVACGGTLDIHGDAGRGTTVRAKIPVGAS
jgi:PAS domain S-box-containing protein